MKCAVTFDKEKPIRPLNAHKDEKMEENYIRMIFYLSVLSFVFFLDCAECRSIENEMFGTLIMFA